MPRGVLVKNIITGEIKRFQTLDYCAEYFDVPKKIIHRRVYDIDQSLVYRGCFLFKYGNDKTPWPKGKFYRYEGNLTRTKEEHERIWALMIEKNPVEGQLY